MFPTLRGEMSRLVVFGLILICCHARVIETEEDLPQENKVIKFLEDFKEKMKKGDDKLGIPVLDPLVVDQVPIKVERDAISLDGLLTNVKVNNLSEYNVLGGDFQLKGLTLSLNLSWPEVVASTEYKMVGKADSFEIYGDGKIDMSSFDFNFVTEISLKVKGIHLQVKSIKSELHLRALDFKMTGLFNDEELSELISAVISDMMPQLIEDQQDMIVKEVNAVITEQLNAILSKLTIGDLLEIFG